MRGLSELILMSPQEAGRMITTILQMTKLKLKAVTNTSPKIRSYLYAAREVEEPGFKVIYPETVYLAPRQGREEVLFKQSNF